MKGGYYTVEASFIMTICIWVIMALFYSGFYVHDRMLVESEMNGVLMQHFQNGEGEIRAEWQEKVKEYMEKKLFLMRVQKLEVKKSLASVDMCLVYQLPISLKRLKQIFTQGESSLIFSVSRELVKPAKYKWDYDMIKGNDL